MAITLTALELAAAMRIGDTPEELAEATRQLAFASEAVTRHAPDAPDVIQNEAVIRLAAYNYDRPFAASDGRYSNALRFSGAAAALLPYREHGAGATTSTNSGGT